jgi:hypothetical protein
VLPLPEAQAAAMGWPGYSYQILRFLSSNLAVLASNAQPDGVAWVFVSITQVSSLHLRPLGLRRTAATVLGDPQMSPAKATVRPSLNSRKSALQLATRHCWSSQ